MDAEQARERFSDALDETLPPDERAELEEALASDPALRAEYDAFVAAVKGARALGSEPPPRIDLVAGVHDKLRRRSRGRYYRDRFSRRSPVQMMVPLALAAATLAVVVGAWLVYRLLIP